MFCYILENKILSATDRQLFSTLSHDVTCFRWRKAPEDSSSKKQSSGILARKQGNTRVWVHIWPWMTDINIGDVDGSKAYAQMEFEGDREEAQSVHGQAWVPKRKWISVLFFSAQLPIQFLFVGCGHFRFALVCVVLIWCYLRHFPFQMDCCFFFSPGHCNAVGQNWGLDHWATGVSDTTYKFRVAWWHLTGVQKRAAFQKLDASWCLKSESFYVVA